MRVCAIGAGSWGKNIVKNLHALGVLTAIVEVNPASKAELAEIAPGVPIFSDPDQAYDQAQFEAVTIAVPAPLHFEIAAVALERGKHCFVEKPITLESRDAEALLSLARNRNLTLMAGHLLLYQPAVAFLREQIHSGSIGQLISVHQERLNLGRARATENVLWSLGVHDVAVALYLVDEMPTKVMASGVATLTEAIEDDVYLHVQFPSGVHSHLHCSWLWPVLRRRTTVIGTEGMLIYNEVDQTVHLHKKKIDAALRNVNDGEELVYEGSGEPLRLEMEHFLHCCKTGETPRSDGLSALEVIRVLENALKSDQNEAYVSG